MWLQTLIQIYCSLMYFHSLWNYMKGIWKQQKVLTSPSDKKGVCFILYNLWDINVSGGKEARTCGYLNNSMIWNTAIIIANIFHTADENAQSRLFYDIIKQLSNSSTKMICFIKESRAKGANALYTSNRTWRQISQKEKKKNQKIRVTSGRFVACHISSIQRPTGRG